MKRSANIHIFLGLIFILLLMGCEKRLSFQLSNQKPKVVMYAFPMPDSILKIHAGYSTFIKSERDLNTLIIDVSALDFVNNPKDYEIVLNKIKEHQ